LNNLRNVVGFVLQMVGIYETELQGKKKTGQILERFPTTRIKATLQLSRHYSRDLMVQPRLAGILPPGLVQVLPAPTSDEYISDNIFVERSR
jgi:hypothetical protein